jgi:hypothetical protein
MAGVKGMRDKLFQSPARAEMWRAGVRIGLIRNRLMKHFLGELELTTTQLKAAEILISKTLPNLAAVEHTGAGGSPLEMLLVSYNDSLQVQPKALPVADPEGTGLRH